MFVQAHLHLGSGAHCPMQTFTRPILCYLAQRKASNQTKSQVQPSLKYNQVSTTTKSISYDGTRHTKRQVPTD